MHFTTNGYTVYEDNLLVLKYYVVPSIFSMREQDDMTLPTLSPMAGRRSEKLQWRSLAYYNCTTCNRIVADYIVNVPEEHLPIPVCSSCYHRMLNNERE
jgi:hypothetical protein